MKFLKQKDAQKDALSKQYIELIIKDILHLNTKLDFFNMKNCKKKLFPL